MPYLMQLRILWHIVTIPSVSNERLARNTPFWDSKITAQVKYQLRIPATPTAQKRCSHDPTLSFIPNATSEKYPMSEMSLGMLRKDLSRFLLEKPACFRCGKKTVKRRVWIALSQKVLKAVHS